MPNTTAAPWTITYAISTDEIKAFPAEVDQVKAERIAKLMGERWLTIKSTATGITAKTGEVVEATANLTVTLPSASTANQIIAVFATGLATAVKITTSGGAFIDGDFVPINTATVTLAFGQHLTLQANGTNWLIVAGSASRQSFGAITAGGAIAEAGGSSADFSVAKISPGHFRLTWTVARGVTVYALTATLSGSAPGFIATSTGTSTADVFTFNSGAVATDLAFSFVAMASG